ncbi:MAG: hypothetical protein ACRED4_00870 [Brevundimonas sp.]
MQKGHRRPALPGQKEARGTARPSRDTGVKLMETVSPKLSLVPPELPDDVAEVWADNVDSAVAHGARQCDADSFAEWCTMAAMLRTARKSKAPAPASYVAQFRMLGELFGLAGPKSRMVKPAGDGPTENPFARNGRK